MRRYACTQRSMPKSILTSLLSSWRHRRDGDVRRVRGRCNRVAQLLRAAGLRRGDHIAFFMENNPRLLEIEGGAERTGLYYTLHQHLPVRRRGRLHHQRLQGQGAVQLPGQAAVAEAAAADVPGAASEG